MPASMQCHFALTYLSVILYTLCFGYSYNLLGWRCSGHRHGVWGDGVCVVRREGHPWDCHPSFLLRTHEQKEAR